MNTFKVTTIAPGVSNEVVQYMSAVMLIAYLNDINWATTRILSLEIERGPREMKELVLSGAFAHSDGPIEL